MQILKRGYLLHKIKAMGSSEIVIAVLLGLLVTVALIYLVYFSLKDYKQKKRRIESGEIDAANTPITKKGALIGLFVYFLLSGVLFSIRLVNATAPLYGDEYWVSVNSSSMASVNSANTYIKENNLKERIYQYDLAAFKKEYGSLKQYDVILFQKNGLYVVHRIIDDPSSGEFHTQGDANIAQDEWVVTSDEVMGVYTHTIPFLSFFNYLSYTPGFYIVWIGATLAIGVTLFFEVKDNALSKKVNEIQG